MTFEELSRQFEKLWVDLCKDGEQDLLAMCRYYDGSSHENIQINAHRNEFNIMVETILKARPEVTAIEKPTIN